LKEKHPSLDVSIATIKRALKQIGWICTRPDLITANYCIVQNGGRGKLWQIWSNLPKFYLPQIYIIKLWIDYDYREKIHRTKMCLMSILKYFHPVKQKPDLLRMASNVNERGKNKLDTVIIAYIC